MTALTILSNTITMTSREIAELTGKDHKHVLADVRGMLEHLHSDWAEFSAQYKDSTGRSLPMFRLPRREVEILLSGYSIPLRAKVVDRLHELEKLMAPVLPSYAETLRLWADQIEATQRVTAERDEAIATKALIGSKREATAMATASAAKREANKLRDELGFTSRHATILHVEHATGGSFTFTGLRQWCKANGVSAEAVPDKRFPKGVKAWPAGAWLAVYGISLDRLFGGVAA